MDWVLESAQRYQGKRLWFAKMTGIGPMTTAKLAEAARFASPEAAAQSPAMRFPLGVFSVRQVNGETVVTSTLPAEAWVSPERPLRIRVTVLGAPRTKKNHGAVVQRGHHKVHIPSAAWTRWCETAELKWDGRTAPPVEFNCRAYFFRDVDGPGDAVGYYQGLADLLQVREVIEDDKWLVSWDGSRLYLDPANPRVEVLLENV